MAVKPIFTLICDDARFEISNKLLIVGLYNYSITFQPQAGQQGGSPRSGDANAGPKLALPLLCILKRWKIDGDGGKATTELIDPAGKSHQIAQAELRAQSVTEPFHQELIRIVGMVLVPGIYTIRTRIESSEPVVYDEQFEVKVAQPS